MRLCSTSADRCEPLPFRLSSSTDWGSASGISFLKPEQNVQTYAWLTAVLAFGRILVSQLLRAELKSGFTLLSKIWWLLPFSASVSSFFVMGASAISKLLGHEKPESLSTGAYLVTGPSYGALSIASAMSLGAVPPLWVGYLMLALLFCSAWVYLGTIKPDF